MLDVIVPCYNEEESIKLFYEKASEILKEIKHTFIFVNDGSNDKTLEILKELYNGDKNTIRIINFSRNFGKEAALYAGFNHSKGDYAAVIDADLQQNPKYLVKMYNFLKENKDYDSIAMCQKQVKKRFIQRCFYKIMDKTSDIHIENGASDFRMFRKSVVNEIKKLSETNRFSKGLFSYVGFNTYYEEYKVEKRYAGNTKWQKNKLVDYAVEGITSFSSKPVRIITYTGISTGIITFMILISILIKGILFDKHVSGSMYVILTLFFITTLILISLGIVGEYIAKIYKESKNRPIYILKERIGFDEDIL